jgi:hypothetical protein
VLPPLAVSKVDFFDIAHGLEPLGLEPVENSRGSDRPYERLAVPVMMRLRIGRSEGRQPAHQDFIS